LPDEEPIEAVPAVVPAAAAEPPVIDSLKH